MILKFFYFYRIKNVIDSIYSMIRSENVVSIASICRKSSLFARIYSTNWANTEKYRNKMKFTAKMQINS